MKLLRFACSVIVAAAGLLTQPVFGQTSPHGKLSIPCEDCHTASGWKEMAKPARFNHAKTSFALKGQHTQVACAQCHASLKFAGTKARCADCHSDVHRGELGTNCERCHSPQTWAVADMIQRHTQTRFSLLGRHRNAACVECHTNEQKHQYVSVPTDCYGCHRVQYEATTVPSHRSVGYGTDCATCHSVSAMVFEASFDHAKTIFPLVGAHAAQPCAACHNGGRMTAASAQCFACHQKDFTGALNPKHGPGFSTDCSTCHSMNAWHPASFDHNVTTTFKLTGAHQSVACATCHTGGNYAGTPATCVGCHQKDVNAAVSFKHAGAGTDCASCHTTSGWNPASYDHSKSNFPLTGTHQTVPCAQCHTTGQYTGTPMTCNSCHQANYANAVNPKHTGFSTDCASCHTTSAWHPAAFDHSKIGFPLTGVHASPAVTCIQCHKNNVFPGTPMTCVGCHQTDFTNAVNPSHQGYPTDCVSCHTTSGWHPSSFDHTKVGFPLVGAHTAVNCALCHKNNTFPGTPTTCIGCHQQVFTTANAPPHTGFSTDCTTCHTMTAWQPASFDHSKLFPLTGAHQTIACLQCHVNGKFPNTPTTCIGCHQQNFTTANAPPHTGFSTDCTTCHTTNAWQPATFDHSKTIFPLTGVHLTVPLCATCHVNNVYVGLSTACVSCHQTDFNNAVNPKHTGYPTDCVTCHTTLGWHPSSFDHNKVGFPLAGAHAAQPCAACHKNNTFPGTPMTCIGCHQTDFANTLNPKHTGFSTDCTLCHGPSAWRPAIFDHSKAGFPLTGTHLAIPCIMCHKNNQYPGTPTACVSCHLTDFSSARNPRHNGYPTECVSCHSTSAWHPSSFDHNKVGFALVGAHASVNCAQCHKNNTFPGTPTTCIGCHQTDFSGAANPSHVGFSTDCTTCHTMNAWQPANFDHTKLFPLVGAHQAVACLQCHLNGQFPNTPTTCIGCHQQIFNSANAPPHTGFSTDCTTCHTMTAWQPATFNHANTPFPLTGGHTTVACALCHVNNVYVGLTHDCYTCHVVQFTGATTPVPHTGFPTACASCHTTTAGWKPSTYSHAGVTPRFPTDSRHTNAACALCHQTATNYTQYCCTSSGCHKNCQGGG